MNPSAVPMPLLIPLTSTPLTTVVEHGIILAPGFLERLQARSGSQLYNHSLSIGGEGGISVYTKGRGERSQVENIAETDTMGGRSIL